jgi:predicted MFS family arabinose efflux permease
MTLIPARSKDEGRSAATAPERRFFYGWVVVGAAVVMLAGFLGTQLCFGVFLRPLADEFGWSRAATSGAMSLCMGVSGLAGILMGRITDRHNMGVVVIVGTLAGTACYLLLARMHSLWQFYLCFGLGAGICVGCSYTPVSATISKWFSERRALALGVALTGIVIGQMVLSPVTSAVINAYGWRTAYVVLGLVVLACGVPAAFLMAKKPPGMAVLTAVSGPGGWSGKADQSEGHSVREAARTAPFWMLMITGFTMAGGFYIMLAHVVPWAQDLGVSARTAALILTVNGVGSLIGDLAAWWLTDRLGGRGALCALMAVAAVAMLLLVLVDAGPAFAVAFAFGFCIGAGSPVRTALIPPLFGLRAVGAIMGWSTFAWSIGGIVGPYLAGFIRDVTVSYDLAFVVGGVLLLIGAASAYFWSGRSRKRSALG